MEKQANEILAKRFGYYVGKYEFEQLKEQQNEIVRLLTEMRTHQIKLEKDLSIIHAQFEKVQNQQEEKTYENKSMFRFG